jgi:hypothetical protein
MKCMPLAPVIRFVSNGRAPGRGSLVPPPGLSPTQPLSGTGAPGMLREVDDVGRVLLPRRNPQVEEHSHTQAQ